MRTAEPQAVYKFDHGTQPKPTQPMPHNWKTTPEVINVPKSSKLLQLSEEIQDQFEQERMDNENYYCEVKSRYPNFIGCRSVRS